MHRVVWNLRLAPPDVPSFEYPIAAVPFSTAPSPEGMWVMPGTYQVRLTVGGRSYRQAVTVRMDPRVRMPAADLALQYRLSKSIDTGMHQIVAARADLAKRFGNGADRSASITSVDAGLAQAYAPLPDLFARLQGAEMRPTATTENAANAAIAKITSALAAYQALR
jgi:hypothetical protein